MASARVVKTKTGWATKYRLGGRGSKESSRRFNTKREAEEFRISILGQLTVVGRPDSPMLDDAFERFLEVKATAGRKLSTLDGYRDRFKHLRGLNRYTLDEITTVVINDYFSDLRKKGASDGTLNKVQQVLSGIFDVAISEGSFVGDNPVKKAAKIKFPKPKKGPVMIPKAQLDALAAEIPAEQLAAFWMMAGLGLRRGEVDALTLDDFGPDFETVHISRTRKNGRESTAKTDKSNRVLTVPLFLRELLRKIKPKGPTRKMFAVHNLWGKKYLEPACERAGVIRLVPHDLRDICAGTLLRNGLDIASVSRQLGHASVQITAQRYIGTLDDSSERAAEVMERLYDETQ